MAEESATEQIEGEEIGIITHYFSKIGVGVIELSGSLKIGDKIRFKGATTDFEQVVESMQIEHENVEEANAGQGVGLKTLEPVRGNDKVFKI